MISGLRSRLQRTHSSVGIGGLCLRAVAFVFFWAAGLCLGRMAAAFCTNGFEDSLGWKNAGGVVVAMLMALQFDLVPLSGDKSLAQVDQERHRQRRSLRARHEQVAERRQRPALRLVAWLLLMLSGFVLPVTSGWVTDAEAQPLRIATLLGLSVGLSVAAIACDAKARDERPIWTRGLRWLFPARVARVAK